MAKEKKVRKISGIMAKHKRGYGFVIPDNSTQTRDKDIFVAPDDMAGAMNGDAVLVRILAGGGPGQNTEGRVEKILSRGRSEMIGTFLQKGSTGYVLPEISKQGEMVLIQKQNHNGARSGDKVVVKITSWPSNGKPPEGKVTEIISRKDEMGGDIKALIRSFEVREDFPGKVIREAASFPQTLSEADYEGRRDLRAQHIFTIDGADAKDFDDAVSVKRLENGNLLLGVHIADVSHYVKEGRPLDQEAFKRGTSIYFPGRVIPMLPRELSNGICSLKPREDRLTLSVDMEIDQKGRVLSYEIYESVISSEERLIYTDVSDILEHKDPSLSERYQHILQDLILMEQLAAILREKRHSRGSLDFDLEEAQITINEEGIPVSVDLSERRTANRMIEEFMIIANETVAEHVQHQDAPFVYRVHEKPDPEKIQEFQRFIQGLGLNLTGDPEDIQPLMLNAILEQVAGKPEEHVVNTIMLRSMKKAFYGTQGLGHFGLGTAYYCHFTSPIRRYPDLLIHRIIKELLREGLSRSRAKHLRQFAEEASLSSSISERKADELEREVEKLLKARYMSEHLDEEFDGMISGVTSFGFFVDIGNTIEGMIRIDSLNDDYYILEPEKYRFIGRNTRKIYALGQKIRIRVESVDVLAREINFSL